MGARNYLCASLSLKDNGIKIFFISLLPIIKKGQQTILLPALIYVIGQQHKILEVVKYLLSDQVWSGDFEFAGDPGLTKAACRGGIL